VRDLVGTTLGRGLGRITRRSVAHPGRPTLLSESHPVPLALRRLCEVSSRFLGICFQLGHFDEDSTAARDTLYLVGDAPAGRWDQGPRGHRGVSRGVETVVVVRS
jgi:hypothetical protein